MASLLKTCLSGQGKKCLSQINQVKINIGNVKTIHNKIQVIIPINHARCVSTTNSHPCSSEKKDLKVIYKGQLSRSIRNLKMFSLVTSGSALLGWPLIHYQTMTDPELTSASVLIFTVIAIYAIGTPLLLHWITKKYVKQIDYNSKEDKYIATIYTILCKEKKIEFKVDDIIHPDIPGMFTIIQIKGIPLFFDVYTFEDPGHCRRIMGYDKPIDFKLCEDNVENVHEKKSECK